MELEHKSFDPVALRKHAMDFDRQKFVAKLGERINQLLAAHNAMTPPAPGRPQLSAVR